jgi:hypothetical protein
MKSAKKEPLEETGKWMAKYATKLFMFGMKS